MGSSKKVINDIYQNKKFNKYDFIKLLEKIDTVYVPKFSYTNVYYYSNSKTDIQKLYNPIDTLHYDDLSLDKYITNLYNIIDKKVYKPPYIIVAHSHGIYYACEFAKQYKKEIKYIISLDGSWISNKINKQQLLIWKNEGKNIPKINNQKTLNTIIDKIKNEKDNLKYINIIFDYVRISNTKFCIKQNYEKIDIPFITFRNFNSDIKNNKIMNKNKYNNNNVLQENKILSKYKNHIIYILLDATHVIWLNDNYRNTIIQTIKLLI
jgi:predicted alpha/beta hydrolase family esterase